jgi:Na+-transporting methylmalonyl-CoA/oxaloacetate decarboxylase gamma subunit
MYYGRSGFGIVFVALHFLAAGAFLYFMYSISKSLKKIAKNIDKKVPLAIEGVQPQKTIDQ